MITKLMGVRIKELRADTGLSQEAFANQIDMARTYFAEVETGKRNVSMRNLVKITKGLGVKLDEFFDSDLFDLVYRDEEFEMQREAVRARVRARADARAAAEKGPNEAPPPTVIR